MPLKDCINLQCPIDADSDVSLSLDCWAAGLIFGTAEDFWLACSSDLAGLGAQWGVHLLLQEIHSQPLALAPVNEKWPLLL